jgi:hypothetical protein
MFEVTREDLFKLNRLEKIRQVWLTLLKKCLMRKCSRHSIQLLVIRLRVPDKASCKVIIKTKMRVRKQMKMVRNQTLVATTLTSLAHSPLCVQLEKRLNQSRRLACHRLSSWNLMN